MYGCDCVYGTAPTTCSSPYTVPPPHVAGSREIFRPAVALRTVGSLRTAWRMSHASGGDSTLPSAGTSVTPKVKSLRTASRSSCGRSAERMA